MTASLVIQYEDFIEGLYLELKTSFKERSNALLDVSVLQEVIEGAQDAVVVAIYHHVIKIVQVGLPEVTAGIRLEQLQVFLQDKMKIGNSVMLAKIIDLNT